MSKLCLVIPIWKRYQLTNHLLTYYHSLTFPGIETRIVVVGSEGNVSRQIARGLEYVEADNSLIDRKYDIGIEYCRQYDPDAVCLLGSDDFISAAYFSWGVSQVQAQVDMVGLLDFYLVDLPTRRVLYWGGYGSDRKGTSIGSGRIYSKRLLERIEWKPYWSAEGYYSYHRDDERAEARVVAADGLIRCVNMAHIGCQYWAVKTGLEYNPTIVFENQYPLVDISECSYALFEATTSLGAGMGAR